MTDDDTNTISFPAIMAKMNIRFGWYGEESSIDVTFTDTIRTAEEKKQLIDYLHKVFNERLDVEITLAKRKEK